jgi:ATP-dependent RNA helicase RhlE
MQTATQPVKGFDSLGLDARLLSILEKKGLTVPTPIQAASIPVLLSGKDVMGIAQTGTGKTLAFGLPVLQKLMESNKQALILVPTRELALQVEEAIHAIGRYMNPSIFSVSLIGGMPIYRQIKDLRRNPKLIIATPGRLVDHLHQETINLKNVSVLVLDEADRMLDMGFTPQINEILRFVPAERQTMLFSATMSPQVSQVAAAYLQNPERIEVAPANTSASTIAQELCYVDGAKKTDVLGVIIAGFEGTSLVFCRTKHGASKLTKRIQDMGHTAAEIHSNRSLSQRRAALDGFKKGRYRILVATDVASRGIDVNNIEMVINYDLPDAAEEYVHRIGRTGRAGKDGKAISLATHDQQSMVKSIERMLKKTLELSDHSEQPRMGYRPAEGASRNQFPRKPFSGQRSSSASGSRKPFARSSSSSSSSARPFTKDRSRKAAWGTFS